MKEEILKYVNEINESKPYCIVLYKTKRRLNSLIEDKIVDSIYQTNQDGTLATDDTGNLIIAAGQDPNRALISGMFCSFSDAPSGFEEEMKEFNVSFGVEYLYAEKFALRTGYFYEDKNKGGRRYFTMGLGFTMRRLGLDFSYLVPQVQNHPLAETLRFSLRYSISSI
jgi:hypothetical protein